ncbi:MAG: 2-oxoglutarate dehydrogenase complex dihydrolipoyllysine-residue succinyltransferase [Bdellovibrionales bacterium]
MITEIKIPAVGESITEATIAQWVKKDGSIVKRDEILLILETDKASVEVVAEQSGKLSVKTPEGSTVPIGSVVGSVDSDGAAATEGAASSAGAATTPASSAKPSAPPVPPPTFALKPTAPPPPVMQKTASLTQNTPQSPAVRRIVEEQGLDVSGKTGSGKDGRLTKGDVLNMPSSSANSISTTAPKKVTAGERITREPMTKLRQTIAKRLVEAQHTAAILTTFNEIDMTQVMALRSKYKDKFKEKHNISLGFMGFFVMAAIEALKAFPRVNGMIDKTDIIFNHFYNIGIAVGTEKGLVVPVIREADELSIVGIELAIKAFAEKARDGKISMDDLTGGTFTISNGGVYGSLMSTPILNPPQSAILGLHKIEERPMAVQGKIEIRPMMYVALSYDHRIIDGSESVRFLVKIKEGLEDPARLLLEI